MSGDGIKAIETIYNGYRFRSRLEARWAVFFDVLGIKYEYEPEGFDLGDAGWYLPDFWLPTQECWYEIKGIWPGENSPESTKAVELSYQTGYPVYEACGSEFSPWGFDPATLEFSGQMICLYTPGHKKAGDHESECGEQWTHCSILDRYHLGGPCPCGIYDSSRHGNPWDGIKEAYHAARSARFEHGDRGIR